MATLLKHSQFFKNRTCSDGSRRLPEAELTSSFKDWKTSNKKVVNSMLFLTLYFYTYLYVLEFPPVKGYHWGGRNPMNSKHDRAKPKHDFIKSLDN